MHPRAALLASTLGHRYLTNVFLRPSEPATARVFRKQPALVPEMVALLEELDESFVDDFDPSGFVLHLPSLADLDGVLRDQLLLAVRAEYAARFQPQPRLEDFRLRTKAFVGALDRWSMRVAASGVDVESGVHWAALQEHAEHLRAFLEDPILRHRWIP